MAEGEGETGQYLYYLNGTLAEIEEHWIAKPQQQNTTLVRTHRKVPGLLISVEAILAGKEVTSFEVIWAAEGKDEIKAIYSRQESTLMFSRSVGELATHVSSDLPTMDGPVVPYPLMRVFTGAVIQQLAQAGGEARVLVPAIDEPDNPQALLLPKISLRRVIQGDAVMLERANGASVACEQWQFIGGQYDARARFWLDDSGRLQRYCWQQDDDRCWDIRLL